MTHASDESCEQQEQQQQQSSFKFRLKNNSRKTLFFILLVLATTTTGSTFALEQKSDPSSPELSSTDFRNVWYEDLLPRIDQFSETGVSHFSEILFDFARYQVKNRV